MKLSARDRRGYLAAFGSDLLINGQVERGILRNQYEETTLGRVRISSNAPELDMMPEDLDRLALDINSRVYVENVEHLVKEFQPDTYANFTTLRLIEAQ